MKKKEKGAIFISMCVCVLFTGCKSGTSNHTYTVEYGERKTFEELLETEEVESAYVFDPLIVGSYIIDVKWADKQEQVKVSVVDTKAPEIEFVADIKEYTLSDDISYEDNIKAVKDPVDGEITELIKCSKKEYQEKIQKINEKKEEIDKREFCSSKDLEKIDEDKDIPHNIVLAYTDMEKKKEGEYTAYFAAIDQNYNVTEKKFKMIVKKQDEKKEKEEREVAINQGATIYVPKEDQSNYASSTATPSVNDPVASAALSRIGSYMACDELVSDSVIASGKITGKDTYDITFIPMSCWGELGTTVSRSQAKAGDVIYYTDGGAGCSHVAIYLGNNQAVHGGFDGYNVVRYSVDVGSGPTFYRLPASLTWRQVAEVFYGKEYLDMIENKDFFPNSGNQKPSDNSDNIPPAEFPEFPDFPEFDDADLDDYYGYEPKTTYTYDFTVDGKSTHMVCPVDASNILDQFMTGNMDRATLLQQAQQLGCTTS